MAYWTRILEAVPGGYTSVPIFHGGLVPSRSSGLGTRPFHGPNISEGVVGFTGPLFLSPLLNLKDTKDGMFRIQTMAITYDGQALTIRLTAQFKVTGTLTGANTQNDRLVPSRFLTFRLRRSAQVLSGTGWANLSSFWRGHFNARSGAVT
ncbi:hypothetical protein K474DRAFT_1694969 [Panus rudis PR-1116 ss-1]|nr:hypothetical protein K474DRAFT_1694969 [Panus rudis PR-1116 ss-1]